mmetsp:Transcript_4923/g.4056  ORF Transcript_4923/g.4056 Transcript_4923/m.4056 type:complete len:112 (-) Transcript_4923:317-652(-)
MSKETKLLPCQYKGPSTLQNNNKVVDEIKEEDCDHDDDTKAFWNKYIAQRKPCVIRGKAKEYIKLMSNDNMIKGAGCNGIRLFSINLSICDPILLIGPLSSSVNGISCVVI